MVPIPRRGRFILIGIAMATMLTALWAGLIRMGWQLPPLLQDIPANHGPLMVSGFLGTLITLERAVALARKWTYAGPICTGLGSIALIAGLPNWIGALLITAGSFVLVAVFVQVIKWHTTLFSVVMGLGALVWAAGNLLWISTGSVSAAAPWWVGFLVLTVAGERLELSRVLLLSKAAHLSFAAATTVLLTGLIISIPAYTAGVQVLGLGMLALAIWLIQYDVARHTIRRAGDTRFIAFCLLSGYFWLGVSGVLALTFGLTSMFAYDALLHSVLLGFIMAMVFGHALVILPAVLGLAVPFRTRYYSHVLLLHLSLLLRVGADMTEWQNGRLWGGLLNAVALLLFVANTVPAIISARKAARKASTAPK